MTTTQKITKKRKLLISLLLLIAVLGLGFFLYVSSYYHASESAMNLLSHPSDNVSIITEKDQITFVPKGEIHAGIIFYPGGKVQYESYAPLMNSLANEGFLCILVHMPFNLAVFDIDAADHRKDAWPNVTNWYLCGHSLGGAMAAYYAKDHVDEYNGLIFLAAYASNDLSNTNLSILTIRGTCDGVFSEDKHLKNLKHLPTTYTAYDIEGGCHAYFGDYGPQKGDGTPTITREEQLELTTKIIKAWILEQ